MPGFESIEEMRRALAQERYLADDGLATVAFLALRLRRPLLVEGEPGVGKTELAKAIAMATGAPLIRLHCYEGIDVHLANPDRVLTMAKTIGVLPDRVRIVGCQPLDVEELCQGLSPPVQRALAVAVTKIEEIVDAWL